MKRITIFLGAGILLLCSTVFGTIPRLINFQGVLKDANGQPVADGNYPVKFEIFNSVGPGGGCLWEENQQVITQGGLFSVLLGSTVPIPDSAFADSDRWLAITVGNDPEMTPRQRLVSVPYGFRVSTLAGATGAPLNTVDGATGGTIHGDVLINGRAAIGSGHIISGQFAFAAGSTNTASGSSSSVGGGSFNFATGDHSIVAGGSTNTAGNGLATVGGGGDNFATGFMSTVSGGQGNMAGGARSTVPGGSSNEAQGDDSFAAGLQAKATHAGTFVWADRLFTNFASTAANQFNVRATGGTRIFSNADLTSGVTLAPGASAWVAVSDSNLKRNIRMVDSREMLEKVLRLPIKRWSYKAQDPKIEHIGPMAQDFYPLFQVGDDEKTISTIDPPAIALAAIQGLYRILQEQKGENKELKVRNEELSAEMKDLKALVQKLLAREENKSESNAKFGSAR